MAQLGSEEPDGHLRRVREDSEHTAFLVLSSPSSSRDCLVPRNHPFLSDRGYWDSPAYQCSSWRPTSCWASSSSQRRSKSRLAQGGDNLPLERYCATIEASVGEILGVPAAQLTTEPDALE